MLADAHVEYLAWAKRAQTAETRVSLLVSGLAPDPDLLDLDWTAAVRASEPLLGRRGTRSAVARRYGVPEAEVLPVLGASLGLFLTLASILRPGDRALVEHPGYESLREVPRALGADVDRFNRDEETGWRLAPDRILGKLAPRTRVVIVSDLHNPTGRRAGDDALAVLAAETERRGITLVVDEVYRDFREGPVGTARRLGPSVVAMSSLTKVYGVPGLRAGWVLADPARIETMTRIQDLLHVNDPAPLDLLVTQALGAAERLRARGLQVAQAGAEVVREWTPTAEAAGLRVVEPDAGLCAWIQLPEGVTGTDFAETLLERGIAVVPGRFFGDDRGIRIGWGRGVAGLPEALAELVALDPGGKAE